MSTKVNPFSDQKRHRTGAFEVDFEESDVLSQNSQQSQSSSQTTPSQGNKRNNPFGNHKKQKTSAYDVDWEDSVNVKSSQESNSSIFSSQTSRGGSQKNPFANSRKQKNSAFEVDWEESMDVKSSQESCTSILSSQNSQASQRNPFANSKKQKGNAFKMDWEESVDVKSSQETDSSVVSSQTLDRNFKKPNPFSSRRQKEQNFEVDFEESREVSQLTQKLPEDSTHTRSNVFAASSKRNRDNEFSISMEESRQVLSEEVQDEDVSQVKNPFLENRGRRENLFDDIGNESNLSVETSKLDVSKQRELSQNFKISFEKSTDKPESLRKSSISSIKAESMRFQNDLDEKEDALESDVSDANLQQSQILNESSFNDENLNQWMSDHSEEEAEPEAEAVKSITKTMDVNIPEEAVEDEAVRSSTKRVDISITETAEERQKRFEMKLKDVIEKAKKSARMEETILKPKNDQPKVAKKPVIEKEKKVGVISISKPQLCKPAKYANRRLYDHVIKKIKPRFGIDAVLKAEEVVMSICETVKLVTRRKGYQKKAVESLKKEMAKAGLIETTFDFYNFVREYLPHDFREKVIPCVQPGTNIVYPPKDAKDPFEKIL